MNTRPQAGSDSQLNAAIRSAFDDIVAATDERDATSVRHEDVAEPVGKRWLLIAAATILLAGVGGLVVVSQRNHSDDVARSADDIAPNSVGVDPATSPEPETSQELETSQAPGTEAGVPDRDVLNWQRAADVGSIARSSVETIVANGTGFVATGMGFDDGRNQGRVWYSRDGITWLEPAFDIFDDKAVYGAAATDDTFYVLAATNTDRTSADEGEGAATLDDGQLYRSSDGTEWSPVGDPGRTIMTIAASGETLLRQTTQNSIEWSTNGDDWFPSELPDGGEGITLLDLNSEGLVEGDATYLRGFRTVAETGVFTIWTSLDNGRVWTELPAPPFGGYLVETPGGLVVNFNPGAERCTQERNDAFEQIGVDGSGANDFDDVSWQCAEPLGMLRFDQAAGQWNEVDATGPGPTPSLTPILRIDNTLVIPIVEPEKALTMWTAPLDATDWAPDPTTTLEFLDNTGSPGTVAAATTDNTIVVASPDRLVDGQTVLLVATTT